MVVVTALTTDGYIKSKVIHPLVLMIICVEEKIAVLTMWRNIAKDVLFGRIVAMLVTAMVFVLVLLLWWCMIKEVRELEYGG